MPGFIREVHRRAKAAKATAPTTPQASSIGTAARLVRAGWDYRERCGVRIWSHEGVNGGHFYSEEMAMQLNDDRKGS
jgi:hypothetical protein